MRFCWLGAPDSKMKMMTLAPRGLPGWRSKWYLPMQEVQLPAVGQEDALEEGEARSPVFSPGESQGQRSLATRGEDWASQGQPKGKAEIPGVTRKSRRNSRKTT